ncbi:rna-dependent rna polymeras-like protein [Amylocarpus encephaloides]|uniref:RNA-dependent RNA polymerase n=1 Tax=Amylocarpus encephaloides TaxID=45428 RepID=A0A9P7YQD7_9HELO|nr:rna-dependent rna polymeras-like protein [Amylocarpus encephaloides]
MEVFVRNVPPQSNDKALRNCLKPYFAALAIRDVHCQKHQGKRFASLTFLSIDHGQSFLARHGQAKLVDGRRPANRRLVLIKFHGLPIYFELSKQEANPYLLRVLRKEADERHTNAHHAIPRYAAINALPISFKCDYMQCGVWATKGNEVVFSPQKTWIGDATAAFKERVMILTMASGTRIDFRYTSTLEITTQDGSTPAVTFTMWEAPRFFQKILDDPAAEMLRALSLNMNSASLPATYGRKGPDRYRLPYLDDDHKDIAGCCLVYRMTLRKHQYSDTQVELDIGGLMETLGKVPGMPSILHQTTRVHNPPESWAEGLRGLLRYLSRPSHNLTLPFEVKFQIQRLAQDGYLSPFTVISLLPEFGAIACRSSVHVAISTLRKFARQIHYVRPGTDPVDLNLNSFTELLHECEVVAGNESAAGYESFAASSTMTSIHRARVTPSSIRLHGPEPESMNRVLRRYPSDHSYFIRVQFCDEDGEPVRFNPRISNENIYHGKFKEILDRGIKIADRTYKFLGYSNSSLRAQSAWFAAAFYRNNIVQDYDNIIEDLGNFVNIRCPAKCSSRIGQTFSDTRTAVKIDLDIVREVQDVTRNGRTFSDGVGTVSPSVMKVIWERLPKKAGMKPTCLQIRFQGAKGMISLDTRLSGDVLAIRESMIKFRGSKSADLEICEAAYKPLPMYFNRQFIKILEDMGVEDKYFLDLQAAEVKRLREVTDNPLGVSKFLTRQSIGETVQLPWFLEELALMNLDFRSDGFLKDVVEVALLAELRQLKHKTRIPVPKGYHLHGLMDETGFLEEGQIFCVVVVEGVSYCIAGNDLIVSRAPALHPGDVQMVTGVKPPQGSPLYGLTNCICFSQKGHRDLPSMLSGGDLDGDRYYLLWDENCKPMRTFQPADYSIVPPLDIGRKVDKNDMTEFFLKFMESDQLGRIAVNHRVKADQMEQGTRHPDCLQLAAMHSTAVDFSKTGIPVDMSLLPRGNPWRPDFEAPGPYVCIEKHEGLSFEQDVYRDPVEREDDDDEYNTYRYYESHKILGKLYRSIDEREIFGHIQKRTSAVGAARRSDVMDRVWQDVVNRTALIQWDYFMDKARDIRDMYEGCLFVIMTEYSGHPSRPLSELEVFTGNILGKTGVPTRRQHELSKTMKEKFNEDMAFIVNCILKDGDKLSEDSLSRSIACFAASLEDDSHDRRERLSSFKYVAAAICLKEVNKIPGFQVMPTLDLFNLPPLSSRFFPL